MWTYAHEVLPSWNGGCMSTCRTKDILDLPAGKQVLDVLGDAGGNPAPLPKPFPDFNGIGGGLVLFEQQVHLVNVVTGGLVGGAVDGNAVPHLVLDHQHPQLFQLLAQLLDVVADDPVVNVHVGPVVEHVQTAGDVDFQRRGDEVGLLFLLFQQKLVQVLQDGHILRAGVLQVLPVDQPHTAVNDRFLNRLEAVLAAHHNVAEGQEEVHFQRKRRFVVGVVQVEVHGIHILPAGGRDFDDLTAQPLDQGIILRLRVCNQDVVVGGEEHVGDFTLGGEGLAAAGSTENQPIRLFVKRNFSRDGKNQAEKPRGRLKAVFGGR